MSDFFSTGPAWACSSLASSSWVDSVLPREYSDPFRSPQGLKRMMARVSTAITTRGIRRLLHLLIISPWIAARERRSLLLEGACLRPEGGSLPCLIVYTPYAISAATQCITEVTILPTLSIFHH